MAGSGTKQTEKKEKVERKRRENYATKKYKKE
jgi:hypothetical protein